MTDAEILGLVHKLEHCELAKTEFPHCQHLAVAVVYLYSTDFDSALNRMRETLVRFSTHHGVPDRYHETLTRFWMEQVNHRLNRKLCLCESVVDIQAALPDKNLVFSLYQKDTLDSPRAKHEWVEPDLKPHRS